LEKKYKLKEKKYHIVVPKEISQDRKLPHLGQAVSVEGVD
jgi:hypothetical protein